MNEIERPMAGFEVHQVEHHIVVWDGSHEHAKRIGADLIALFAPLVGELTECRYSYDRGERSLWIRKDDYAPCLLGPYDAIEVQVYRGRVVSLGLIGEDRVEALFGPEVLVIGGDD